MDKIIMVNLNELHDFKNHPFKVEENAELFELTQSIKQEGVIVPLLARANPYGDGYSFFIPGESHEANEPVGET